MMDNAPLKEFIDSLSHISGLDFEIRNKEGTLHSSGNPLEKFVHPGEIDAFSGRIFKEKRCLSILKKDRYALFGAPIMNGEGAAGSIIALEKGLKNRTNREMEIFLTRMASIFEDKWRSQKELEKMSEEVTRGFEDLYIYSRVATKFRTLNFTGEILGDLIGDLIETMRTDLAFSHLPEREEYNVAVSKTDLFQNPSDREAFIKRLLNTIPQEVPSSEEGYFVVNDSRNSVEFSALHPDPYRFLAVKMQHKGALYGWLGMASFNLGEIFRRSELSLLSWMAEQMAVVIANTDLYRDLERFVVNVVKSLVYAIEAKDLYTRGHSERVNTYCMMMAKHLDMEEGMKKDLHWASILHDVGKIGIPESILSKTGRLTDQEYGIIKGHAKQGYDILRPIEQLDGSLHGILYHHERIDGRGYPDGMVGEEIPLIARIIAVADTFDAISSNRAYRRAKAAEKAISVMEEVAGTQLDPHLVDLFKALYESEIQEKEKGQYGK